MVCEILHPGEVNVLVAEADWAWPMAVRDIFEPRGVNMLLAKKAGDVVEIVSRKRIHTAIIDFDSGPMSGLGAVRILRECNPLLPCIMVARSLEEKLLKRALDLDVFSVIGKPVDFELLREQLDRLFVRRYQSDVFKTKSK